MEIEKRLSVNSDLKKFDFLAKGDDFIEITQWTNRQGWDISINDKIVSLTYGQLEAINYLTKTLEYNN